MANTLHLSKLSRGHVEASETGSRLEIFADPNEKGLVRTSKSNVPKTYSTKRGPLILFAETSLLKKSRSKLSRNKRISNPTSLISPPPLKFGELKRSILAYGGTPDNQMANGIVDEDGTFIYMKLSSKRRLHPSKYAGISPNVYLRRRYMMGSTEDRRRELDSVLDSDYPHSRNHRHSIMKTHVLSDEISLIPPILRHPDINQHSLTNIQDTYRLFQIENTVPLNDSEDAEEMNSESQAKLQIIDSKGSHVSYEKLDQTQKEKVLTGLLLQTALHNMSQQQNIEVFEDALNRVRDADANLSLSQIDIPNFNDDDSPLGLTSNSNQNLKSHGTSNEPTPRHPQYMFGKMPGSKWAKNRPLPLNTSLTKSKQTNENEQISDGLNSEYTQSSNDLLHTKLLRASRLLAPITSAPHHDSSSVRNQPYHSTKFPLKSRKTHDIDYQSYLQHYISPMQSQQNKSIRTGTNEYEKSSTNLFFRQRSSKSSKKNRSRQDTVKTYATNRCVSSPFSAHEEAERIFAVESFIEEDDGGDDNDDHQSVKSVHIEPAEEIAIGDTSISARSKTEDEYEEHLYPSETNLREDPTSLPEIQTQKSAYTHRSHVTTKSKSSSTIPSGALLIAPDGEVLSVGGPTAGTDQSIGEHTTVYNTFAHQPSTASMVVDTNDDKSVIVAPCVPVILGTKRERSRGETVVRRTLNLSGGDFNSQFGLQSWSYDAPVEKRPALPQTLTVLPPVPIRFSAFTGRKYHQPKRIAQEVRDHAIVHSSLSVHSEVTQHQQVQRTVVPQSSTKNVTTIESEAPLFSFTSWTYRRPPTPPTVTRPYLYRPDYRPAGAHGYKHHLGDHETLVRRTINIHSGDIDASLSFTIWVYDMWINDLVKNGADPNYIKQVKSLFDLFKQHRLSRVDLHDKEFLTALASHAQALARIVLKRSDSGVHLDEDAQLAIIENIRNLKNLLDERLASVSDDVYRELLRDTLQHVLRRGNLQNLQITDEILMSLMDYPTDAFEIFLDTETNEEYIRLKSPYQIRKDKIKIKKNRKKTKTVIISEEISIDDFEKMFDEQTGEYVYRIKKHLAEQKGFTDLIDVNFDIIKNDRTGKYSIQIKQLPKNLSFKVEIYTDPDTGKQTLIWKKEVLEAPSVIESDISVEDFELVTDQRTGETVLRLKPDVAIRKGLTNLSETNFEFYTDPNTGQTGIRIRQDQYNSMNNKRIDIVKDKTTGKLIIRMIFDENDEEDNDDENISQETNEELVQIIENDIDLNDFERVIDPNTGREILRMKADVLKAKGLEELANAQFEIVVDSVTGQSRIILKTPSSDLDGSGNTNFEITVDIVTGKQKIIKKIITLQQNDYVDIVESQLNFNDLERVIDPNTGLEVLQLKKDVAARKGLTDLLNVQFEVVTGADGKPTIVIKGGGNQGNADDAKFEIMSNASGRTTIKLKKERPSTTELEIVEKQIDMNDFEEILDPTTGVKVLKLKPEVAKRAGMMGLLETHFETYIDTETGKPAFRIKQMGDHGIDNVKYEIVTDASGNQVLRMIQEIPKAFEVTNSDINANDFEEVIDEKTGEKVLRMKKEVAERKGFTDMTNVDFEFGVDEKTGEQIIQIKNKQGKLNKGNVSFDIVIDPATGQQTLKMKQEVEVKFETVENDLATDDFEEVIDQATGERILKLTADAAARKGLTDLREFAFETYVDPTTGKQQIRMKGGNPSAQLDGDQKVQIYTDPKTGQQKIVVNRPKDRTPPPVEKSVDIHDFEKTTDPQTGKESYRLTEQAIRRKGLTNVKDMNFDIETDTTTGKPTIKPKVNDINGQKVDVITNPTTGKQTMRVVQEKPSEKLATITTTIDLDKSAFSSQTDPQTGKQMIGLDKNLMESYGLENVEFEKIVDPTTGQTTYQMKPVTSKDGKVYQLVTDPVTGKQSLQVQEVVTQKKFTDIIQNRDAKGLHVPKTTPRKPKKSDQTKEGQENVPTKMRKFAKNKSETLTPDESQIPSPADTATNPNRRKSQVTFKSRLLKVKSPTGQEFEIDWTSDDDKEIDQLSVSEQRRRKEELIMEKRRQVAEMKRKENLEIQQRLQKQRESLVGMHDQSSALFNNEEQERERDLRKLDADRNGLTEEEYQAHRKKLFDERTRVLKSAYDRKMDGLKHRTSTTGEQELDAQIRAEEDLLLSMMNESEREDYIRARDEERTRQRLMAEREQAKREEELQAAIAETKRMAAIRAAEIMAKELRQRSKTTMYNELKNLVTEQKISRAFTYSYYSLLQFLSPNTSPNTN